MQEKFKFRGENFPHYMLEIDQFVGPTIEQGILEKYGVINGPARNLLAMMTRPVTSEKIKLVQFQLRDIDFPSDPDEWVYGMDAWRKIVELLEKHKLMLCPQVTAPLLALRSLDVMGKQVTFLSEPIVDRTDKCLLFQYKSSNGRPVLDAYQIGVFWHDEYVVAQLPSKEFVLFSADERT